MQIVGYRTTSPVLLVAADGTVERVALDRGTRLDYALGARRCAGLVRETPGTEGGDDSRLVHEPCDAPAAPYCETHTVPWAAANNADSEEEHAVYLAAFAPATFKVGVTRTWRLETRLREQGADRAAHVATEPDGRAARALEGTFAARTGPSGDPIGERVRVERKVEGLAREIDTDAWETLLAGFDVIERFAFDYGLALDRQPVPETLATGTVRGTKGRILVIERSKTTYAVDLRDLVGHEIVADGDRDGRQASLGRFER